MSRWLRSGISPSLKERRAVLAKNKIRILLKIKKRSPHLKKKKHKKRNLLPRNKSLPKI